MIPHFEYLSPDVVWKEGYFAFVFEERWDDHCKPLGAIGIHSIRSEVVDGQEVVIQDEDSYISVEYSIRITPGLFGPITL